jgi:hypothetical protein
MLIHHNNQSSDSSDTPEPLITPEFQLLVRLSANMQGPTNGRHVDWVSKYVSVQEYRLKLFLVDGRWPSYIV